MEEFNTNFGIPFDPGIRKVTDIGQLIGIMENESQEDKKLFSHKLRFDTLLVNKIEIILQEIYCLQNNIGFVESKAVNQLEYYEKENILSKLNYKISILIPRINRNATELRLLYDSILEKSKGVEYSKKLVEILISHELLRYNEAANSQDRVIRKPHDKLVQAKLREKQLEEDLEREKKKMKQLHDKLIKEELEIKQIKEKIEYNTEQIKLSREKIAKDEEEDRRRETEFYSKMKRWLEFMRSNLRVARINNLNTEWETVQELTVMNCKAETKVLSINYGEIKILQYSEVREIFTLSHPKPHEVPVLQLDMDYAWDNCDLYTYDEDLDYLHLGYSEIISVLEAEESYFWDYEQQILDSETQLDQSLQGNSSGEYPLRLSLDKGCTRSYACMIEGIGYRRPNKKLDLRKTKGVWPRKRSIYDRGKCSRAKYVQQIGNKKIILADGFKALRTFSFLVTEWVQKGFVMTAKIRRVYDRGK